MVPFLHYDLISICHKLLELIVKPSLTSDVKTSYDLMQIDLSDSKSLLKISDAQIGFFALREVQGLWKCDEITLDSVKVFKNGCRLFVTSMLNRTFEKCPYKSVIVRSCRLFIRSLMATNTVESNKKKLLKLLNHMINREMISPVKSVSVSYLISCKRKWISIVMHLHPSTKWMMDLMHSIFSLSILVNTRNFPWFWKQSWL